MKKTKHDIEIAIIIIIIIIVEAAAVWMLASLIDKINPQ